MDLEYHSRAKTLLVKLALELRHRDLDHVGVRTLDRHVDRLAFRRLAQIRRQGRQIREVAATSLQRLHIALRPRRVERGPGVLAHPWEGRLIIANELDGLTVTH